MKGNELWRELPAFSVPADAPERNALSVGELLHPPGGLETAGREVHRDEQPRPELSDELAGPAGIAVADAAVYGEHDHIEVVRDFPDVFQLTQIPSLFFLRVDTDARLRAGGGPD